MGQDKNKDNLKNKNVGQKGIRRHGSLQHEVIQPGVVEIMRLAKYWRGTDTEVD